MNILILEDNQAHRQLLAEQLQALGHKVEAVENGQQGYLRATSTPYDISICDVTMPQWDGLKFIEAMTVICPRLPIIVTSSSMEHKTLKDELSKYDNIAAILSKPVQVNELKAILDSTTSESRVNIHKMARIVCTIGPACRSKETIDRMLLAGMNVARLNFSHGTYEEHEQALNTIRQAERKWQRPTAVLMDLCGPKIRVGEMENGAVTLIAGAPIIIQAQTIIGTSERLSTIAPEVLADLREGDQILLDDGMLELKVINPGREEVLCRVISGGSLGSHKGINLPSTPLSLPCLTAKDKADLEWGLNHSIDFVALSFVRSAADIRELKEIIKKADKRNLKVVAKIEKPEAVRDIKDIIKISDAIMIARGDLGVEMPAARVPWIQNKIIKLCWEYNTPVITATQMLESMTHNPRPTRAEVTDVNLAISQGTDAVMLSGETAAGIAPVNAVRTMAAIVSEAERHRHWPHEERSINEGDDPEINSALTAAVSMGGVSAILVIDFGNDLYRHVSKWNHNTPALLATNSIHEARHACLYKNITPMIVKEELRRDGIVFWAIKEAQSRGYLRPGDTLAVLEGHRKTQGGIPQLGSFQIVQIP